MQYKCNRLITMEPKMRVLFLFSVITILMSTATVQAAGSDTPTATQSGEMPQVMDMIKAKRFDDAVEVLDSIVRFDPYNADAWNLLGYSLRKLKKYELAEKNYLRALDIDFRHIGALEYLGELYAETGRKKEAEAMLKKLQAACSAGCEEVNELRAAISGYQSN